MKKISFLSNGCQCGFGKVREIIAANPDCREVVSPRQSDILMVNFCAISQENLDGFEELLHRVIHYKRLNPKLKIIAGGCVEGLTEKKDLSFADAIFHHQGEAEAFVAFLEKEMSPASAFSTTPALAPAIIHGAAAINIAQGCNRRCSFCKVHFLNHMQLTSRPLSELLDLVRQAVAQGINTVILSAENSTEYGTDIGTNLQALLEQILAMEGVRILDVHGLCIDEVTPELLQILKHPKIRTLQLEVQSLNDQIRKKMYLRKTTAEALAVLDALSDKFLVSNFMVGFPGHSIAEFNREMRLVRSHHLYFLSFDPYDDTPGTPSHEMYTPVDPTTMAYYQETFLRVVAGERQLVLKRLMTQDAIEASIAMIHETELSLYAMHYSMEISVKRPQYCHYQVGDMVRVKITGLHETMPDFLKPSMPTNTQKSLLNSMRYFDTMSNFQLMPVSGEIIGKIDEKSTS